MSTESNKLRIKNRTPLESLYTRFDYSSDSTLTYRVYFPSQRVARKYDAFTQHCDVFDTENGHCRYINNDKTGKYMSNGQYQEYNDNGLTTMSILGNRCRHCFPILLWRYPGLHAEHYCYEAWKSTETGQSNAVGLKVTVKGWGYSFFIWRQLSFTAWISDDPDAVKILTIPRWRTFNS